LAERWGECWFGAARSDGGAAAIDAGGRVASEVISRGDV